MSAIDLSNKRIGFIGAGQMAEALALGFVNKGGVKASNVYATDINQDRKDVFAAFGANACDSNSEVVSNSDVVFVAVKPQYVSLVLREVKPVLAQDKVVVSIAAGVTLSTLQAATGADARIIRVMPNTPCLVGETAAAMCLNSKADDTDAEVVKTLFDAVGTIYRVDEKLLSAVTGLSGSGPAYIFVMIEALSDGGVKAGLPRDVAIKLAAQTVKGAAAMVLETGKHPGALKDMVTSPAGTTIAGVHELEKAGVRNAFINAVTGAAARADELAKME
jgi:pyrroline-5-carboxylate reductase|mmetsp:Transcript_14916/g.42476  ORF Transcript_14916/g.42476 Transcript_14916/m.42476 type:complete len:276 (-) Transcript_14916:131-958(-)|eukprot:CAMPEP_0182610166 /NCGR_PEP_ID=MMETSP1330-20130603/6245_1 /TAXON_ID=464278 /ORGANISM="Picochlorum sp., Strain RCC944" /LENGTH=275 /DNA_ID=CAMNT_0024829293 /DNA_START=41 /DNA_END=868 /DNA_ORIENTATION=+